VKVLVPDVTRDELNAIISELDPTRKTFLDINEVYSALSDRFGQDASRSKPTNIVDQVKLKIRQRAGHGGIKALSRFDISYILLILGHFTALIFTGF